jgi:hypothetical protein
LALLYTSQPPTQPLRCLQEEGMHSMERISSGPDNSSGGGSSSSSSLQSISSEQALNQPTLVCFVMVDPHGKHAFCRQARPAGL